MLMFPLGVGWSFTARGAGIQVLRKRLRKEGEAPRTWNTGKLVSAAEEQN